MDCPIDGRLRWVSKPFKRWAFAKGEAYTRDHSLRYAEKYLYKFIRKQIKMSRNDDLRSSQVEMMASCESGELVVTLSELIVPVKQKPPRDKLRVSIENTISKALHSEGPSDGGESGQEREWIHEFTEFTLGLGEALDKNIGLDHSKVREYWLSRGPRMMMTAILYFLFVILAQETLKGSSQNARADRWYTVTTSVVALIIAIFMLYKRLGDAIEGVVARSSHDFYAQKKKGFKLLTLPPQHVAPPLQREVNGNGPAGRGGRGEVFVWNGGLAVWQRGFA